MPDCDNNSKQGVYILCAILFLLITIALALVDGPLWVAGVTSLLATVNIILAGVGEL